MPAYLHPGVYIEETPSGANVIASVSSSTALFVGAITKGSIGEATLITQWENYQDQFGGILDTDTAVQGDAMGHSVSAFFQNGGSKAYIVRLANTGFLTATGDEQLASAIVGSAFTFNALNAGVWGDALRVQISEASGVYSLDIGTGDGADFVSLESYSDINVDDEADAKFLLNQINGISSLVTVSLDTEIPTPHALPTSGTTTVTLAGGDDGAAIVSGTEPAGSEPELTSYADVFSAALKLRDISIICLPGQFWNGSNSIVSAAIAHCEAIKNRMLIIDLTSTTELDDAADVTALSLPTQTYVATYYPWVVASNPYYNAETNPTVPSTVLVPPCGYAAGMWAKVDSKRGIWKAPAGVGTGLLGVAGLEYTVSDDEQDFLNPAGVNALRNLPGYGSVIWGARTLSTNVEPEWRYIPVRRTALFIEESLYNGIQWAVFEGNNHVLWSSLRANIEAFMNRLFRAGAFQGESTSDAYFVRCGLGDTMTQTDIDKGQVIVLVGFAPLKPAEFVILRLQQKVGN